MTQAFAGVRIIDFSSVLAAPNAVQQLALLGAEVIKIEQPGVGDMTRGLNNSGPGLAPSFMNCNLNKRSITLDLKHSAAAEIVQRLVKGADAVVENMRPGVMSRLGFGYEELRRIKPDLVYCSVSGYGQTGPRANLPAFDGAIQAASGMVSLSGHAETGPVRAGYFAVDMATALNTAFALSAALYRRLATGAGQHVDVAMMDTAMIMLGPQISAHFATGNVPDLIGNLSPTRNPTANVFATADGYVQIVALKQAQAQALFEVLGIEDLLQDSRYATPQDRTANASGITAAVAPLIAAQTTEHWITTLTRAEVPVAPIRALPEVVADPQFDERDCFVAVTNPISGAPTRVVGSGHSANVDGPALRNDPPLLGADTDSVLAELGYTEQEIAALHDDGAL